MTVQRPQDVFLFSSPRTLSNLLCHMLSAQPGWDQASYHYHDAFIHAFTADEKGTDASTPELVTEVDKRLQTGFQNMKADMSKAHSDGKPIFLKSHANQLWNPLLRFEEGALPDAACIAPENDVVKTNPTMLPDEMMLSWTPVFLIRNPILIGASWIRAENRAEAITMERAKRITNLSLMFPRAVFEWYNKLPENQRSKPVIIDADDLVEDDRAINDVCRRCNMDEKNVIYEWETKEAKPEMDARFKSYIQGLWNSKGVDKSKSSKGVTLDGQYKGWCDEFGTEIADVVRKFAEDNMDSYLYLKSFAV